MNYLSAIIAMAALPATVESTFIEEWGHAIWLGGNPYDAEASICSSDSDCTKLSGDGKIPEGFTKCGLVEVLDIASV